MKSNLILSGGVGHEFAETSAYLAAMLKPLGVASTVTDDWTGWADDYDMVTVNGLRWRMRADRYEPLRAAEAFATPWTLTEAITHHLARGGALLVMHAAIVCMDDWPEWEAICGGGWDWEQSFSPAPGDVYCHVGRKAFTLTDVCYHLLRMHGEMEVVATGRVNWNRSVLTRPPAGISALGLHQPMAWIRTHGGGRVAVDVLGHDVRSLEDPDHQLLLYHLVARLLRLPDAAEVTSPSALMSDFR